MLLNKINIKNFRSIAETIIDFRSSCRILVGINESGKSNILKALRFLSPDFEPTPDDKRFQLPNKREDITESTVRFLFKLSKTDRLRIGRNFLEGVLSLKPDREIFEFRATRISLNDVSSAHIDASYNVDIIKARKFANYSYRYGYYSILPGWKKTSNACPPDFNIEVNGVNHPLSNFSLIYSDDFPEIDPSFLAETNRKEVEMLLGKEVRSFVTDNLPECIFWEYSDKYLIPPEVELASFLANPNICLPLKNMFELARVTNIQKVFEEEGQRHNGVRNLLTRVARTSTRHIKSVWKEKKYRSLQIDLFESGGTLKTSVQEKNYFGFFQRSDGFKRFVSFLLIISAKVKTNDIEDALILIDEADSSLHPSGAEFLRDELIQISEKNNIVYSTHSIFMIDRDIIGRHYLVSKDKEITTVEVANESNVHREDVLFRALGTSIYDFLMERNIVFEGWRDKKLFLTALESTTAEFGPTVEKLQKIGHCNARGASDVHHRAAILEAGRRKFLVLSDNDKPAAEFQEQFNENYSTPYGVWLRYPEVQSGCHAITGEDFLEHRYLRDLLQKLANKHEIIENIDSVDLADQSGCISSIREWLKRDGKSAAEQRELVEEIKEMAFTNLRPNQIAEQYFKFLEFLVDKVTAL